MLFDWAPFYWKQFPSAYLEGKREGVNWAFVYCQNIGCLFKSAVLLDAISKCIPRGEKGEGLSF